MHVETKQSNCIFKSGIVIKTAPAQFRSSGHWSASCMSLHSLPCRIDVWFTLHIAYYRYYSHKIAKKYTRSSYYKNKLGPLYKYAHTLCMCRCAYMHAGPNWCRNRQYLFTDCQWLRFWKFCKWDGPQKCQYIAIGTGYVFMNDS